MAGREMGVATWVLLCVLCYWRISGAVHTRVVGVILASGKSGHMANRLIAEQMGYTISLFHRVQIPSTLY